MLNPDYNILKDWMFGKLASLLENTAPNPKYPIIKIKKKDIQTKNTSLLVSIIMMQQAQQLRLHSQIQLLIRQALA